MLDIISLKKKGGKKLIMRCIPECSVVHGGETRQRELNRQGRRKAVSRSGQEQEDQVDAQRVKMS